MVAKSPPDGHTLFATPPGPLLISQSLFHKLAFDPAAFVPVSVYAVQPYLLVAHPKTPASSLGELIAFAKAHPDKLNRQSTVAHHEDGVCWLAMLTS